MTPNAEQILAQLRALSPEEQQQIWTAVQEDMQAAERARRIEAAQRIRGKYKDLLPSSEDFLARKHEETEREERRFEERLQRWQQAQR